MRIFASARLSAAAVVMLAVAGCSTANQRPVASADLVVLEQTSMPPPTNADLTVIDRPAVIGPLDRVSVDVFNVPELRLEQIQVDGAGRISMPLLGALTVAGSTPGQVADQIATGLRGRYIRDPHVTVNLIETRSQIFTVEGEVHEPGNYPVVGRMSLMRAIASAKGTSEFALLDNVVVLRTVGNQRMAALYNLQAIRRGIYPDPEIYANDVVVVGNNQARRIFRDALQLLPALTSPLVVLLTR